MEGEEEEEGRRKSDQSEVRRISKRQNVYSLPIHTVKEKELCKSIRIGTQLIDFIMIVFLFNLYF